MSTMTEQRIDRTLAALTECVVWHPDFVRAYELAQKSMAAAKHRRAAASMLLLGETGVGKSTCCTRIEQEVGVAHIIDTEQDEIWIKPCLLVELPTGATIKSVAMELLKQLGIKNSKRLERLSSTTLTRMVIQRLIVTQTQLIILDEFHRLLDRGAAETKKNICRWINQLLNQTKLPILLVGLPKIEKLIDTIDELSDRYPYRTELRYFNFSNEAATRQFHKLVEAIEQKVIEPAGFTERVSLTQKFPFKALCLATDGNLRHLHQLLGDSLTLALSREGVPTFTLEDLASSAADLHFCRAGNPFRLSGTDLKAALKERYG